MSAHTLCQHMVCRHTEFCMSTYRRSTANQRIESWWGMCAQFWMDYFQAIKDQGYFSGDYYDIHYVDIAYVDKAYVDIAYVDIRYVDLNHVLRFFSQKNTQHKSLTVLGHRKYRNNTSVRPPLVSKVSDKLDSISRP